MHEASMVASILRVVEEEAAKHNAQLVRRVVLRVGVFTGLEQHTLAACFSLLAEGTCVAGATLDVEMVPANAVCQGCGYSFALQCVRATCPRCQHETLRCTGGKECLIQRIDV